MRNAALILALFTCLFLSAQKGIVQAQWLGYDKLAPAGKIDWSKLVNRYDDRTDYTYTIASNSSTLLIGLVLNDKAQLLDVISNGINLSISRPGKNLRGNITFPYRSKQEIIDTNAKIDIAKARFVMNLKGFKYTEGQIPALGLDGFAAAINSYGNAGVIVEFTIPVREILGEDTGPGSTIIFSADLMIKTPGGWPHPDDRDGMPPPPPGGMDGGGPDGGGPPPGGMGGPPPGFDRPGDGGPPKALHFRFKLATMPVAAAK